MRIQAHIATLSIQHNQAIYPTSNTIFTFFSITVKFPRFSYQSRQNIGVGKISAKKSARKSAKKSVQTPATVHFFFIINAIFLHHASILQAWKSAILFMLLPPIWQQKGGVSTLEILTNFFLSVMAGVISYYICKWLNGRWRATSLRGSSL